jgi:hypothetical protein
MLSEDKIKSLGKVKKPEKLKKISFNRSYPVNLLTALRKKCKVDNTNPTAFLTRCMKVYVGWDLEE